MQRSPSRSRCGRFPALALLLAAAACTGIEPELRSLVEAVQQPEKAQEKHVGPTVEPGDTGTARFVEPLHSAFRAHKAMETVSFIDRFYRAPANHGYDEVLQRLDKDLHEAGFESGDPRLKSEFLKVSDKDDAWTPVSAELVLLEDGAEPRVLHKFEKSEDVDRVMLSVNAPSCDITAEVALGLDDLKKGMILATNVDASQVTARAKSRGAAAIVSASLYPFNEDFTDANRHLDAIQFRTRPPGEDMPIAQISPNSMQAIEEAVERAKARGAKVKLHYRAEVVTESRPLRTLMASIVGSKYPDQAVVMVSHVQEPGACDNATGVAGLLEGACSLAGLLKEGKLPWPERTLVFLWGDEFRQTESWLASTTLTPVAGISSDMTGQSKEATNARALLERNPDPGALKVLAPDGHTPWGAGQVNEEDIQGKGNGLALIARCAMADVNLLEGGNWVTAEHPWEGGSDHDIFIQRGVPAVLFWHFTDFAYHTSLDRMQFVDPTEMRRTGTALLATALAVATAAPGDLERYLASNKRDCDLRVQAARDAKDDTDLETKWTVWCDETRAWLRHLCGEKSSPASK